MDKFTWPYGIRPRYQYRIPRGMQRRRWRQPAIQRHRRYGHKSGDASESTTAPVLGRVRAKDQSEPQALYICGTYTNVVWAVNIESDAEPVKSSFFLPAGGILLVWPTTMARARTRAEPTRLVQDQNLFGDDSGDLWALNDNLQPDGPTWPVPNEDPNQKAFLFSTPVIYKDPQGGATVLFGVKDDGSAPALYGYDPATRNSASIPTGTTFIYAVAPSIINGIIYAGGYHYSTDPLPPQLFGIRVDELPKRCEVSSSNRS